MRRGENPAGQARTDSDGLKEPAALISKEDTAGPGVCGFLDHITWFLERGRMQGVVYALNPGKLRVIWDSIKKTDKDDALKPARHIQRYPGKELPVVSR